MKKQMRVVLLLCMVGILAISCATTGEKVSEPVRYSEVVDVANMSKEKLYTVANLWFVDAFRNAGSVIQYSDKEAGVIKGKYIGTDAKIGIYVYRFSSTITINVKESRYRIVFENPKYECIGDILNGRYPVAKGELVVDTKEMADIVKAEWKELSVSLKKSIGTKSSEW